MKLFTRSLLRASLFGVTGLMALPTLAATTIITFDEATADLQHGTVLNNQFSGVTISAQNFSTGPDLAVLYDTTATDPRESGLSSGQYDPDLEGPSWGASNLHQYGLDKNSYVTGNAVIIQENNRGCDDGVCNRPDDEGSRPSGIVTFDFDFSITSLGFDLIDFENVESRGSSVTFYNSAISNVSVTHFFSDFVGSFGAQFGNNSINRIMLTSLGLDSVNRAVFDFGGSGAVDTLVYTRAESAQEVSEPISLALFASALLGLAMFRRRQLKTVNNDLQ